MNKWEEYESRKKQISQRITNGEPLIYEVEVRKISKELKI